MFNSDIFNEGAFIAPSFFDSSNVEDFNLNELIKHIEDVLKIRFNEKSKHDVEKYSNRITFSCPYCGDSDNIKKKRGNIFFESLFFHCFVCGYHTSAYNLIKKFKDDITPDELLKLQSIQSIKNASVDHSTSVLNLDLVNNYILPKERVDLAFGVSSVIGTKGGKYLMERGQNNLDLFGYSQKHQSIIIYNMDHSNRVLGFISRTLRPNITNKYLSWKLSSLYTELNLTLPEEAEYLDKLSLTFNILKLDFNKEITVFEGPFDAFLFHNSVALSGVSKNLPFSGENIRYWLDNDDVGLKKTKEFLGEGKQVFLWKKYLVDNGIPTYLKIKDLTDLVVYAKNQNKKLKSFENYFSDSKLDLFFL